MIAYVLDDGAELLGIAGMFFNAGQWVAFSELRPALRARKVLIAKCAKLMRQVYAAHGKQLVAIASPVEPGSERFLEWCGFERVMPTPSGVLFLWRG